MYTKTLRDVHGKFQASKKLLEQAQKCPTPAKPLVIGVAAGVALATVAKLAFEKITS